jgi:DNA replication protein DnaC
MPTDSPRPLDQVRRPKWQQNSELPLPQNDWGGDHDPFAPVKLESNLAKWEAFDWDRHPKLRSAKRVIVDWYNGLPGSGALVLAGEVGCGKTHLADAIADLYGRWRISYYEEIQLVKKIQASYGDKGQSEDGVIAQVFRPELFILDDLGTYRTNNANWLLNLYNRIFNDYLTRMAKPLLITTNLPMIEAGEDGKAADGSITDRIGTRSFSRLCDGLGDVTLGRYVDLFGITDYRIQRFLGE